MTRMEELKDELELLKIQLTQQGEELERLRGNLFSNSQGGTPTHSVMIPPLHHGPVDSITKRAVVLVTCTTICRAVSLDNCTFREAEQGGWCGRVENLSTLESKS